MTDIPSHTRNRARNRAIRDHARQSGLPFSEAARQLDYAGVRAGETLANHGRTIYPIATDTRRRSLVEARLLRSRAERLVDTRRAAVLPDGRAAHLVDRFPAGRGADGTGVGPIYAGPATEDGLALLYLTVAEESPVFVPAVGDLTWIAELGEETALDTACAALDRAVRRAIDTGKRVHRRIRWALDSAVGRDDVHRRHEAIRLGGVYAALTAGAAGAALTARATGAAEPDALSLVGARQILDALLIVADDGHAPGTRVRMLAPPDRDRLATIVGARWGPAGPPIAYEIRPDAAPAIVAVATDDLVVLAGQDARPMATR
jgi:hypothetical protein